MKKVSIQAAKSVTQFGKPEGNRLVYYVVNSGGECELRKVTVKSS